MKVDRSLFLVFTGAIAASAVACVVKEYQPPPPPPPAPPPPVAQAPAQPATNAANPHFQPIRPGQATNNPPAPPHFIPIGPHTGPTPTPTPNPPAPSACLDQGNTTAPTCSASLGCSGNAFPMQRCQAYLANFDPKVAASAVNCMNGLGANMCDSQHDYDCGKAALAQACADNTTAQLCQIASGPCKVAATDCVAMLSGLNTTGQDAVAQCVAGGCSGGLYSCIEGLGASASAHR